MWKEAVWFVWGIYLAGGNPWETAAMIASVLAILKSDISWYKSHKHCGLNQFDQLHESWPGRWRKSSQALEDIKKKGRNNKKLRRMTMGSKTRMIGERGGERRYLLIISMPSSDSRAYIMHKTIWVSGMSKCERIVVMHMQYFLSTGQKFISVFLFGLLQYYIVISSCCQRLYFEAFRFSSFSVPEVSLKLHQDQMWS
jgi:hypothetical protein